MVHIVIAMGFDVIYLSDTASYRLAYDGIGLASFHKYLLTSCSNIFGCSSFLTLRGNEFQLFIVL